MSIDADNMDEISDAVKEEDDRSENYLESSLSVEPEDEDNSPLDLPKSAFTPIHFSSAARRVIDLYRACREDHELDPRPSFQRGYVWDKNKATRLIESILLHVPLPLVYTAEEENGTEVVIDGQQRLTTCFSFIEGFFLFRRKMKKGKFAARMLSGDHSS